MDRALNFIRGLVRPLLTTSGFLALLMFVWRGVAIPDWLQVMIGGMVTWWFLDRTKSKPPGA